MDLFTMAIDIRWADLDPNFHLRHSVYYDYGAACRISFLQQHSITAAFMQEHAFGPVLFREECIFKKEIRLADTVSIDLTLLSATRDFLRWSIQHNIKKNTDVLSAVLTVEGAWINIQKRKLAVPPAEAGKAFDTMPKHAQFKWM